ncbi:MAG TPA: tetratricopeptide repeat protein [Terriglobales bacterium]|jgi:tetratricopeptide (TPR) repeat protein|nr:tetratricopeptide repeat protein [Terriglobales bacterium]
MTRGARLLAFAAVVLALFGLAGCNKLKARDQLNKGVQAYKNAKYEDAIEKFKNAVALDPSLINARLYLATAYAQQYIPGADTPDNNRMAEQAINEYQDVLKMKPNDLNAIKGIAYLYLQMKKFDQSSEYYRKVIAVDPNDPEAYYSVAVIDWTKTYQPRMEEKAKLGLKPDQPIADKKVCADLKTKNQDAVKDGMTMLEKAISLRPDYDDAMAYYNLMWREQADIECGDAKAREEDLKKADEWVKKTMATKAAKAEKQQGPGGITVEKTVDKKD